MKIMKTLLLFTFLLFPSITFSQSVNYLFLQIPNEILEVSAENRPKLIIETKGDFLKFRLSEARKGELKIVSQKKDEVLVGMTVSDCEGNTLQFFKVKNGSWKDVTKDVIKPLGKNDLVNILKASPVTVTNPNQELGIAMFYEFATDSTNLKLIARKQDSCDVAGTVYNYKFNGKKFDIQK